MPRAIRTRKPHDENAAFRALAHPMRRDILLALGSGPQTATTLTKHIPISRPAISKHLRILREAGLVTATRTGRERHHTIAPEGLRTAVGYVHDIHTFWHEQLTRLDSTLRP